MKRLHHSWVHVLLSACVLAVLAGSMYSFGIFLVPLTTEFNWGRGELSGVGVVAAPVGALMAIIAGRLSDKYGPRRLVTTFGVVAAIGYALMSRIDSLWQVYLILGLVMPIGGACCLFPVTSTIPRWFKEKRATAIGFTITGFGVGAVIWPPLTQWLISSFGWRQAFITLGLVTGIVAIPLAQFLRHSPQRAGLLPYGESEAAEAVDESVPADAGLSLREAAGTRHFWLWAPIYFSFFFILQVLVVHITAYALDSGVPTMMAAATLSIIAGISIIGRLSGGYLSERIGGIRRVLSGALILMAFTLVLLLSGQGAWSFYTFAALFGLAYGLFIVSETALPAELFGARTLGTIMATLGLFPMAGGAIGQTLAGFIFDVTGSYRVVFLICTILAVTAAILSLPLLRSGIPTRRHNRAQSAADSENQR